MPVRLLELLAFLEDAGHESWLVGGALRDRLLGQHAVDWDVATTATPAQITLALDTYNVIPIGPEHGTVRAVQDSFSVDITTFRADGAYTDRRHPDRVTFHGSIKADLSRRDFTINALAWHPARGLIDPFGGLGDLETGCIRAVGEPAARISEDPLRIMRALRFASVLGFSIEPSLQAAMTEHAPLLAALPRERLGIEWSGLLYGRHASEVTASYFHVLRASLPVSEKARPFQAWRALAKLPLANVGRHVAFSLAMALDDGWFNALVLTADARRTGKAIRHIVLTHRVPDDASDAEWRWFASQVGLDVLYMYASVRLALTDDEARWRTLRRKIAVWRQSRLQTLGDLAVNGRDLLALGLPPVVIGEALKRLFLLTAAGDLENDRDILLGKVKLWYNC